MTTSLPRTMPAIRKLHERARPVAAARYPGAADRPPRCAGGRDPRRHLRHRPAHLRVGRLEPQPRARWASRPGTSSSAGSSPWATPSRGRQVGQRVSAEGHIGCGVCQPCRTGQRPHLREGRYSGHRPRRLLRASTSPCRRKTSGRCIREIPDHIAAIFDPLGNAMHTVMAAGVSGRAC